MASSSWSSSSSGISQDENSRKEVLKEIRNHEIAIGELDSLSASRAVYHKIGNIYFRRSIEDAKALEEKKLVAGKARLQKLDAAELVSGADNTKSYRRCFKFGRDHTK
ncbi:uncharacterized protein LOC110025736 [Phalaenopsis equestris]|uniref:uncharacterized protein LOC110025736 n=1 Tax=Phalaenopsis equestris TaxID=78828 RepID=UPI0009E40B28|nr:uncharacterized protein LOC110025736 [Phalaenopsis equestris]